MERVSAQCVAFRMPKQVVMYWGRNLQRCNHAIYTVRKIVDKLVSNGYTANLCTIDLSKAFDKVNHYALFVKLMDRRIPVCFYL